MVHKLTNCGELNLLIVHISFRWITKTSHKILPLDQKHVVGDEASCSRIISLFLFNVPVDSSIVRQQD